MGEGRDYRVVRVLLALLALVLALGSLFVAMGWIDQGNWQALVSGALASYFGVVILDQLR